MEKVIYLEADEEITSTIDRIQKVSEKNIALVIPKRAVILQSIVNLKLLKRQIDTLNKDVVIVTTDKIGKNLAMQVGFTVYTKLDQKAEVSAKPSQGEIKKPNLVYRDKPGPLPKNVNFERNTSIADITYKKPEMENRFSAPMEEEPKTKVPEGKGVPISTRVRGVIGHKPHPEQHKTETPRQAFHKPRKPVHINKKILWPVLGVAILIILVIIFFVLPKATISIDLKGDQVTSGDFDTNVKIAGTPDLEKNIIVGENISVEREQTKKDVATTGKKDIGGKATGTITVFNSFSSDAQPLVVNTRFISASNGKTYRIQESITVPGATISGGSVVSGKVDAKIQAEEPGEAYNLPPGSPTHFTIPGLAGSDKYDKIYGEMPDRIVGGYTETINVLSQQDVNNNNTAIIDEMTKQAYDEVKSKLGNNKKLLEKAVLKEVVESVPSVPIDTESGKFDLRVKVKLNFIAFDNNQFLELVNSKLNKDKTTSNVLVYDENSDFKIDISKIDLKSQTMTMKVNAKGYLVNKIDENKLKDYVSKNCGILGCTKDDTVKYISSLKDVQKVQVNFWPFYVSRMPKFQKNIDIKVNIQK